MGGFGTHYKLRCTRNATGGLEGGFRGGIPVTRGCECQRNAPLKVREHEKAPSCSRGLTFSVFAVPKARSVPLGQQPELNP
jgi:hypothetical protein